MHLCSVLSLWRESERRGPTAGGPPAVKAIRMLEARADDRRMQVISSNFNIEYEAREQRLEDERRMLAALHRPSGGGIGHGRAGLSQASIWSRITGIGGGPVRIAPALESRLSRTGSGGSDGSARGSRRVSNTTFAVCCGACRTDERGSKSATTFFEKQGLCLLLLGCTFCCVRIVVEVRGNESQRGKFTEERGIEE